MYDDETIVKAKCEEATRPTVSLFKRLRLGGAAKVDIINNLIELKTSIVSNVLSICDSNQFTSKWKVSLYAVLIVINI